MPITFRDIQGFLTPPTPLSYGPDATESTARMGNMRENARSNMAREQYNRDALAAEQSEAETRRKREDDAEIARLQGEYTQAVARGDDAAAEAAKLALSRYGVTVGTVDEESKPAPKAGVLPEVPETTLTPPSTEQLPTERKYRGKLGLGGGDLSIGDEAAQATEEPVEETAPAAEASATSDGELPLPSDDAMANAVAEEAVPEGNLGVTSTEEERKAKGISRDRALGIPPVEKSLRQIDAGTLPERGPAESLVAYMARLRRESSGGEGDQDPGLSVEGPDVGDPGFASRDPRTFFSPAPERYRADYSADIGPRATVPERGRFSPELQEKIRNALEGIVDLEGVGVGEELKRPWNGVNLGEINRPWDGVDHGNLLRGGGDGSSLTAPSLPGPSPKPTLARPPILSESIEAAPPQRRGVQFMRDGKPMGEMVPVYEIQRNMFEDEIANAEAMAKALDDTKDPSIAKYSGFLRAAAAQARALMRAGKSPAAPLKDAKDLIKTFAGIDRARIGAEAAWGRFEAGEKRKGVGQGLSAATNIDGTAERDMRMNGYAAIEKTDVAMSQAQEQLDSGQAMAAANSFMLVLKGLSGTTSRPDERDMLLNVDGMWSSVKRRIESFAGDNPLEDPGIKAELANVLQTTRQTIDQFKRNRAEEAYFRVYDLYSSIPDTAQYADIAARNVANRWYPGFVAMPERQMPSGAPPKRERSPKPPGSPPAKPAKPAKPLTPDQQALLDRTKKKAAAAAGGAENPDDAAP